MPLFDKLKTIGEDIKPAGPAAPVGKPPDKKSIYRNRYNFGVNFGSLFLLEKFIFHQFFINDTNTEFDAISAYIKEHGEEKTRSDLENHWNSYVTDDDWNWLKSKGVTGIRIPVGYWHVDGGSFTKGTPFSKIAPVYKNSWGILKSLIAKAEQYGIGVLVDLHALPGGANTAEHSGIQLKKAEFWGDGKDEKIALSILEFIAQDLKKFENISGLQIINESEFDNTASHQKN
jgi:aryl-phospho-beta-D-glucosidase BglC (GH1 family)